MEETRFLFISILDLAKLLLVSEWKVERQTEHGECPRLLLSG